MATAAALEALQKMGMAPSDAELRQRARIEAAPEQLSTPSLRQWKPKDESK